MCLFAHNLCTLFVFRYGLSWNPNVNGHLLSASDDHVRHGFASVIENCFGARQSVKKLNRDGLWSSKFTEILC